LSEFADYVEREQSRRAFPGRAQPVAPSQSGNGTKSTVTEDHAELDIIDTLNLAESSAHVRLKDSLLDTSSEGEITLQQLSDLLQNRLLEGHGETLFDLGQEDNGESMEFSKEQWDIALDRIRRAASFLRAECRVLLTRNVGGAEEAETVNDKDKSATGKLLIRQKPETTEEVIETRIAVVGNGTRLVFNQYRLG
jgi:GTPase